MNSDHPEYSGGAGWLIAVVIAAIVAFVLWNATADDDAGCDLVDPECVAP